MSETSTDVIWLTQEAHDKLEAELNELKTVGRPEVSARIASAREEQGQMESRIRQLEDLLRRAQVGEPEGAHDEVAPGKVVTVAYDGDADDTETFLLGSREILGTDSSVDHAVSPQAPLGAAIVGAKVGDEVRYEAPNGREIMVVVTNVTTL